MKLKKNVINDYADQLFFKQCFFFDFFMTEYS